MGLVKFGDYVKEVKINIDRNNNPYEYYVAGDHMDSEELTIRRKGLFATDDVGPAFTRLFKPGQILYGSRRTYLKKVAVADFEGICSNTTFVLETKDENKLRQRLLPFIMLTDVFTKWSISKSKGSTNPYILFSDLANYEFELPDINRQDELVNLLWQAYATKESYREMIRATDEMVKSQFIEMFGCDPIGNSKWPTKTFGELFDISSSRRILKDDWAQEGVPFLRVRDLIHYSQTGELRNEFFVSESFYDKLKDTDGKVQDGDILVSATSTIGKCMIVQNGEKYYYKDADVLRFREKDPVNKVFFIYGITMPTVGNQINDTIGKTTVGHFLISKAATIKQPLPPIAVQEAFERVVNQADKSKFELKQAIEKIDKVMRALMQ